MPRMRTLGRGCGRGVRAGRQAGAQARLGRLKQSYIKYKSYLEKLEMSDEIRRKRKQADAKKQDLEDQLLRFSNLLHAATVKAKRCASSCSSVSS